MEKNKLIYVLVISLFYIGDLSEKLASKIYDFYAWCMDKSSNLDIKYNINFWKRPNESSM